MDKITLVPDESDYGVSIKTRGKKVVIECDTVASARAVRRQVQRLIVGDDSPPASAIGFMAQLQDEDVVQSTEAFDKRRR